MLTDALEQLKPLAGECAGAPMWPLSDDALVDCLDTIHQVAAAVTAAESHLIREIDRRGLPVARHATSTAVWLREHLRISVHAAKRMLDLAAALDQRPALDTALVAGVVNAEQAAVVAAAIQDLPADLGPDLVDEAEAVLIGQAAQFEPTILRKAGQRILAHVAPEIADAADAAALARMEERAFRTRAFHLTPQGDGRVRLTGWLDEAGAATVNAALDPLCAPAVLGSDGQVLDVGRGRRLIGRALRRALELRDRGCAFPGCDRPPRWCDGHHIRAWVDGGATSLDNSVLLCGFHHRIIHGGHWVVRLGADGLPEFIPPTYVDPRQAPRRNLYHLRT